ncbi:hypothetical protein SAY86_002224 [Trapa natans]|uniref:Uncharacterized protein n=1 Tax=Trapa natans TaxID=22666 RepID=A0AAN7LHG9_TRANT|nr:hypothetical protein SAY86_002224 [Trapa natans]
MVMASARELKRRKTEKKSEPNVSSSSGSLEKHESNECWNNFSIRINGPMKIQCWKRTDRFLHLEELRMFRSGFQLHLGLV